MWPLPDLEQHATGTCLSGTPCTLLVDGSRIERKKGIEFLIQGVVFDPGPLSCSCLESRGMLKDPGWRTARAWKRDEREKK